MEEEFKGLKDVLRSMVEGGRAGPPDHLGTDTLVAYHSRELAPEDAERARDHLAICRRCTSLLLELDAFDAEEAADAAPVPREALDAGWATLRERLFPESAPPAVVPAPPAVVAAPSFGQRLRAFFASPRPAYAVPALLFVALSLALVWAFSLRRQNEALLARQNERQALPEPERPPRSGGDAAAAPDMREFEEAQRKAYEANRLAELAMRQRDEARARVEQLEARAAPQRAAAGPPPGAEPNVEIVELKGPTRGREEAQQVVLPSGVSLVTLTVPAPPAEGAADYTLKVFNNGRGAHVLRVPRLRGNARGKLTASLPTRELPAGRYTFQVYANGGGEETLEMELAVVISYR